jgi:hypothetical protein
MASGTISCDTEIVGSTDTSKSGNKMIIKSQLDKDRTVICPFGYCNEKQLAIIKSKIMLKFGSVPFSLDVKLDDETVVSITAKFYAFGSGKKHKL